MILEIGKEEITVWSVVHFDEDPTPSISVYVGDMEPLNYLASELPVDGKLPSRDVDNLNVILHEALSGVHVPGKRQFSPSRVPSRLEKLRR